MGDETLNSVERPWALELVKNALMISMYTTLNTIIYWPTYLYNIPELSIEAILPRKKTCKNLLGDEKICKKKLKCFFKECNILDDPIIEQIRLLKGNTNDDNNSNVTSKMSGGSNNKKMKKLYESYYNKLKKNILETYNELDNIRKKKNKLLIKYLNKILNNNNNKYKLLKNKKRNSNHSGGAGAFLKKKLSNGRNAYTKGKNKLRNVSNYTKKKMNNIASVGRELSMSNNIERNNVVKKHKICCLNPTSYRWCDPYKYPDPREYKSDDGKILQLTNYILNIKDQNTEILGIEQLTSKLGKLLLETIEKKNKSLLKKKNINEQEGGSNSDKKKKSLLSKPKDIADDVSKFRDKMLEKTKVKFNGLSEEKINLLKENPEIKTTIETILRKDLKPRTLFRLIIILKICKIIHDNYPGYWNYNDLSDSEKNNENNEKKSKKGSCLTPRGGGNTAVKNDELNIDQKKYLQDTQSDKGISLEDYPDYVPWPYPDVELLFDSKKSYSKCLKEMLIGSSEAASSCLECPTCYLGKTASKIWGEVIDETLSSKMKKSKMSFLSSSLNYQIDTIYDTLLRKYTVFNETKGNYESQKRYLVNPFHINDKDGFSTFLNQILLMGICSDDIDIYKLKSMPVYEDDNIFITTTGEQSNNKYIKDRKKKSQEIIDGLLGIPEIVVNPDVLESVFKKKDGKQLLQNMGKIYDQLQHFDILDIVENEYYKVLCNQIISLKNSNRMNESTLKQKIMKAAINNHYFLYGNKKKHPFDKKGIDYNKIIDFTLYAKQFGYSKSLLNKINSDAVYDKNRRIFNNMIKRYMLDPPNKFYSKHTNPDDLLVDTIIYLYRDIADYTEQLSDYLNSDNYNALLELLNKKKSIIENILDIMNGGDKYKELLEIIRVIINDSNKSELSKEYLEEMFKTKIAEVFSITEHDQIEDLDACIFFRKKLGISTENEEGSYEERIITDSSIKNEKKLQMINSLIDMLKLNKNNSSKMNNIN